MLKAKSQRNRTTAGFCIAVATIALTSSTLSISLASSKAIAGTGAPASSTPARSTSSYKTFWPPVLNQIYPDIELTNIDGKRVKLSSYAGRTILIEPIGMSCPACQAFVGGAQKGGLNGVSPQGGLPSMDKMLSEAGVSPQDNRLVRVQLLLYGPSLQAPSLAEAQAWAKHFDFGKRPNELILLGDKRYINDSSYNMIPGFQLVDKSFVLRSDSTGHSPRNNLYSELVPMVRKVL